MVGRRPTMLTKFGEIRKFSAKKIPVSNNASCPHNTPDPLKIFNATALFILSIMD
jgi:hypothetical protein